MFRTNRDYGEFLCSISENYCFAEQEDKNSLFLNYNLSTNYLHDEAKVKSLQKLCILTAVVNAFKSNEARVHIEKIIRHNLKPDYLYTIVESILRRVKVPQISVKEVKLTIRLVFKEIERFLEPFPLDDKFIFLENLCFNCQGAINPRETVLKILESNIFRNQRDKFEFSCLHLFDEDIICGYFNDLELVVQNFYLDINSFNSFLGHICFYWVWKLRTPQFQLDDLGSFSYSIFTNCSPSNSFFEIGVQYLFENLTLPLPVVCKGIRNFLDLSVPRFYKINITMYMISQMFDSDIIQECNYELLIHLIKNPRWHGIFIKYFRSLRHVVDHRNYILLVDTVKTELEVMIEREGENGDYIKILKDFIILIPFRGKRAMKANEVKYAKLVFELFLYGDIKLLQSILTLNRGVPVFVPYAFYDLVMDYFGQFKSVYDAQFEMFLRRIIRKDKISDLLTRLQL